VNRAYKQLGTADGEVGENFRSSGTWKVVRGVVLYQLGRKKRAKK